MEEEERCEEAFDGNHEGNEALPELKFRESKENSQKLTARGEEKIFSSETFHLAGDFSPCAAIFKNLESFKRKFFVLTGCGSCTHIDELYSK
jgi:hypothetical protein